MNSFKNRKNPRSTTFSHRTENSSKFSFSNKYATIFSESKAINTKSFKFTVSQLSKPWKCPLGALSLNHQPWEWGCEALFLNASQICDLRKHRHAEHTLLMSESFWRKNKRTVSRDTKIIRKDTSKLRAWARSRYLWVRCKVQTICSATISRFENFQCRKLNRNNIWKEIER